MKVNVCVCVLMTAEINEENRVKLICMMRVLSAIDFHLCCLNFKTFTTHNFSSELNISLEHQPPPPVYRIHTMANCIPNWSFHFYTLYSVYVYVFLFHSYISWSIYLFLV